MAAPIAHVFLAVQMLAGPFKGLFNEKEFIVGASFPDIQYLKVVCYPPRIDQAMAFIFRGYFRGDSSGKDFVMRYFDINEPNAWHFKRLIFSWFYARKIEQTMFFVKNDESLKHLIIDFYTHFSQRLLNVSARL